MAYMTVTNTLVNGNTADAGELNTNFFDVISATSDGTKDMNINALTCAGAVAFNGNTTLGNATSDTVTFTARVASSILPSADDTYDLGSAALQWRQLYADDITVNATTLVTDAANGRVGIGTASPQAGFDVSNTSGHIRLTGATTDGVIQVSTSTLKLGAWSTGGSLNIDMTNGNVRCTKSLLINDATAAPNNSSISLQFLASSLEEGINSVATGNVTSTHARYYNNASNYVGSITTNNSVCYFNNLSDSRIKTDKGLWHALDMVKSVPSRKYIKNKEGASIEYGFYAQELYDVLPQAVTVGGDNVDTDPWMIDYSKTSGVLWKAIQELSAKNDEQQTLIESLTSRIEALEAK